MNDKCTDKMEKRENLVYGNLAEAATLKTLAVLSTKNGGMKKKYSSGFAVKMNTKFLIFKG